MQFKLFLYDCDDGIVEDVANQVLIADIQHDKYDNADKYADVQDSCNDNNYNVDELDEHCVHFPDEEDDDNHDDKVCGYEHIDNEENDDYAICECDAFVAFKYNYAFGKKPDI